MFGLCANSLFLEKMSPRLVLSLHLAIKPILFPCRFILLILLDFFQFLIEDDVVLELVLILSKQTMLHNI